MTIGYDMRVFLAAEGFTDISVNNVDDTRANTISIMETGGLPSTRAHKAGKAPAEIIRPSFQIVLRRTSKETAAADIENIRELLDGIILKTINGTKYITVQQVGQAVYLGKFRTDAGDTNEYSLNFETQIQTETT